MRPFLKAKSVELLLSGEQFFDALGKTIDQSTSTIHFQTYIFKDDETGRVIAEKLIRAAKRGVKIYMLIDGYGSKELDKPFIEAFKLVGIEFRFFSTFFSSENVSLSRRLHHKVVVIDNAITIVGGINIGNHYKGFGIQPAWLDFAVLIRGNLSIHARQICDMLYYKKVSPLENFECDGEIDVRFRRSDWIRRRNEIYATYKSAVKSSHQSISLFASYFLPGFFFLRRLKFAVKRGVKVRIVVGAKSDIFLFHHAEKYLYDYLLRNGIEMYEWKPSVMHAKLGLFDDKLVTIGSYNLNNLSRYSCIETNVDIDNVEFGRQVSDQLNLIIHKDCNQITLAEWKRKMDFLKEFGMPSHIICIG